jgi:hypothetical protein
LEADEAKHAEQDAIEENHRRSWLARTVFAEVRSANMSI